MFFLGIKAFGRAAAHRSPDWGCSNKLFLPESRFLDMGLGDWPTVATYCGVKIHLWFNQISGLNILANSTRIVFVVAFSPQILKLNGRSHASFLRDMLDLTVCAFPEKNLGCSVYGCSFWCVGTLILNFNFILNVNMRSNASCKK